MKKVLWLFTIIALLGCMFVLPSVKVKAEEVEQPETSETQEVNELDKELIKEYIVEVVDKYLGKYFDKQTISLIASLVLFAISNVGLLSISIAYNKYKKGNVDLFMNALAKDDGKHLTAFVETLKAQNDELKKEIKTLKDGYETMMKVFVLSQDKSAEGKVVMLEYIGKHTENKEVQEKAQEISGELEKEVEVKQEVNEKVKDEYQEIF